MLKINNLHATVALLLSLAVAVASVPANASNGNEQPPVLESKVATGSVTIPDEIAPAVIPYLFCLTNAVNAGLAKTGGANVEQTKVIEDQAIFDCRPTREKSLANADAMLKKYDKKLDAEGRSVKVETTLVAFENMAARTSARMEAAQAELDKQVETNADYK